MGATDELNNTFTFDWSHWNATGSGVWGKGESNTNKVCISVQQKNNILLQILCEMAQKNTFLAHILFHFELVNQTVSLTGNERNQFGVSTTVCLLFESVVGVKLVLRSQPLVGLGFQNMVIHKCGREDPLLI